MFIVRVIDNPAIYPGCAVLSSSINFVIFQFLPTLNNKSKLVLPIANKVPSLEIAEAQSRRGLLVLDKEGEAGGTEGIEGEAGAFKA